MGLKEYQAKRDFSKTAEPKPRKAASEEGRFFVIQKHAARRLHYDFRLEMKGVLKSWAVPKGIPYAKGDKRLAVLVEDHPLDYARFEGIIPEKNYGAGTVMVWDIGECEGLGSDDPAKDVSEGKLHFELRGKKLKGEWTLIHLKHAEEENQWLLLKSGESIPAISAEQDDESVLSGRTMKQIAEDRDAEWISNRGNDSTGGKKESPGPKKTPAKRDALAKLPEAEPRFHEPMMAKAADEPPGSGDWIYELKFDGYRALAVRNEDGCELYSRKENLLTDKYPIVSKAVEALGIEKLVLDGEIVALDEEGRPSFQLLQNYEADRRSAALCYYVFDILNLDGKDLRAVPLSSRKELLQKLIQDAGDPIRFSASLRADPKELLGEVRKRGLEGIIGKLAGSRYESGQRSGAWIKLKVVNEREFVIGGYTPPEGSRHCFGALILGFFEDGKLLYAGKAGSGFTEQALQSMHKRLQPLRRDDCPFVNLPTRQTGGRAGQGLTRAEMRKCVWVQPELVCQIEYGSWTEDGFLRHPVFLGLREDKVAGEVGREE